MKPKPIAIDLLRTDGDTQNRVSISEETVEEYAELIAAGGEWPFPPLDVFHDGAEFFAADGFHRLLAAVRAKRSSVPCLIHKGTARDARIFGMTANDKHGLRMSRADKRACVEWLLDNGGQMTQVAIAEAAGVSTRTVRVIVADRKSPPSNLGRQTSGPSGGVVPDISEVDESHDEPTEDYGKCPNCAGTKWTEDEFGVVCSKCNQPHGEPAGDVDEDRITTQRQKTVKTVEALTRAFDDSHHLLPKPKEHKEAIEICKRALKIAKEWRQ